MSKARATSLIALTLTAALCASAQQPEQRTPYRLSLPGESWALELDLSAFNVRPTNVGLTDVKPRDGLFFSPIPAESYSDDGLRYQLSAMLRPVDQGHKYWARLRVTFGPAQTADTAAGFRDYVLKTLPKRAQLKEGGSKPTEYKGIPLLRFRAYNELWMSPPGGGSAVPFYSEGPKTLAAYFVRNHVWVSVALGAEELGEREEKLLYSLLDSARFVDTSAPSNSLDYYHLGRVLYLNKEYHKAREPLTMALGLEHRERRLDTASWRDLVSKLIDSLAGTGELKRAKELMDYAASADPSYPVFQLALARYHARLGDLDNTIASLQKAFLNRENAPGARLPDPSYDPAFERFRKDERFRKALKALKK